MRTEARRERVLGSAADVSGVSSAVATATEVPRRSDFSRPALRLAVVGMLALCGLRWDLWTKQEVFARLGCPGIAPVWKGQILGVSVRFELATTFNHGALWGVGQGQTWLFASLSFVAIAVIVYFLWNGQAIASWWLTVVTGLLLAGTLGNLFDRLGLHRHKDDRGVFIYAVRDFLDFYFFNDAFHWATFNCADMYLVIGAGMLVLHSFWVQSDEMPVVSTTAASCGIAGDMNPIVPP